MNEPSNMTNLYETLGINKDATPTEIKSAYRRLALLSHPDKLPPASTPEIIAASNEKFQAIGFAYTVLKDELRRKRYDLTGRTEEGEEGLESRSDEEWKAYFKQLWKGEVNAETLDQFKQQYQGSEEEKEDLFNAYNDTLGSLDKILATIMCSTLDDEDRFITLINQGINDGKLTSTSAWRKESKDIKSKASRRTKASKEALEAEAYAKELGVDEKLFGKNTSKGQKGKGKGTEQDDDDEAGLRALIQSKQAGRMDSLIGSIEAKYEAQEQDKKDKKRGKGGAIGAGASKKQKKDEEPTDEEFARIQAEVEARRASNKNGGGGGGGGSKRGKK